MQKEESPLHRIGISYIFGRSSKTDDVTYHTARLNGTFSILEGGQVSLLLPFNLQSSPLGDVRGLGDVIVVWNQDVVKSDDLSLKLQFGGRFASGDANGDPALPQLYQSGLGSNDVLFGATASVGQWDGTIGYQIAGGRSSNAITRLQRSDDFLLRIGYACSFEQFSVHPSLLFIQRLGNSTVANASYPSGPEFIELPDSAPSQLNLQMDGSYFLSALYSIEASVAFPFLKRRVNVDGLTRAVTVSVGIVMAF
ncbi:MAG: hypothetical protein HYV29_11500 [Ignavibacteriales bacterium]|nr:hypothetical protein [Ignavibacteriales bacterium]